MFILVGQGAYLDDTFAFLEAAVSVNLTKILGRSEDALRNLRKFMGGREFTWFGASSSLYICGTFAL